MIKIHYIYGQKSDKKTLLFRGKRLGDGKWVEGMYCYAERSLAKGKNQHKDWIVTMFAANGGWLTPLARYPVIPETIGQYTGFKDKNNQYVFDGDILLFGKTRFLIWWNKEAFQWQAKLIQLFEDPFNKITSGVVWDNVPLDRIACEKSIHGKTTSEIIGNIYDNPELMMKKIKS